MTPPAQISKTLRFPSGWIIGVLLLSAFGGLVASETPKFDAEARGHWAFQKVARPSDPKPQQAAWVRNSIDSFVLRQLENAQIQPSPQVDKTTLLRRASLDLIGLPPTPEEISEFLNDDSPNAFDRVVDRLLASPHYGERWARHWLDLARYAESEGFKADETRPNAWRYRDYVITSLNADKPYDRFLSEQIAGDELWPEDHQARIATGFNRHYPDESNARNLVQRRQEILNDITDTVGGVFIGMTYACARCHDHKYDPILQSDYYRLQAFFINTAAVDDIALVSSNEVAEYRAKLKIWEEKSADVRAQIEALEAPKRKAVEEDYFNKYPAEIQAILNKPESERSPFEKQMAWKARQYLDPRSGEYIGASSKIAGQFKGDEKIAREELKAELQSFAHLHPGSLPVASGMVDLGDEAPKARLLARGAYDKPRQEVAPGLLQILQPGAAEIVPARNARSTGRRAALAKLLVAQDNPLTARVMVNRIWQYHFGQGIVRTPSDFGFKGERPTHPELLDWLAAEFRSGGWSMKHIHRLIMTSATYQQNSNYREAASKIDPQNKLLWRFPRTRLEGEVIRDSALAVAGLLNTRMGGPSVFPDLPDGMPAPRGGWKANEETRERNRRSIYVFVRRNTRYPMFDAFDMPDPHESCARRNVTTSPVQALTLLNSKLSLDWAKSFAARVIESAGKDRNAQIEAAYRMAYGRLPSRSESLNVKVFFKRHRPILAERQATHGDLVIPSLLSAETDPVEAATLVDVCHMLLNSNEFVYRN